MKTIKRELINTQGLNASKPLGDAELPKHVVYAESGHNGETTDGEQALVQALVQDQEFGHIEFVGANEALTRLGTLGGPVLMIMRGDKLAVFALDLTELLGDLKDVATHARSGLNNMYDKDKIVATLREIGTESALAEIEKIEQEAKEFQWIAPKSQESDEADLAIWEAWADAQTASLCCPVFRPEKIVARHAPSKLDS